MSVELLGYAASGVVAVSLMMGNITRLRWLNLAGSVVFAVYGALVHAWPVAAVNCFISAVDAYYLWQLYSKEDFFSLLEVPAGETLLNNFLDIYAADIKKYFPGFSVAAVPSPKCVFMLRNLMPVGLFIYEREGGGTARVHLDYVVAAYRDLRNTRFLFRASCGGFLAAGIREFVFRSPSGPHKSYLLKMGFSPSVSDPSVFIKPLVCASDFKGR